MELPAGTWKLSVLSKLQALFAAFVFTATCLHEGKIPPANPGPKSTCPSKVSWDGKLPVQSRIRAGRHYFIFYPQNQLLIHLEHPHRWSLRGAHLETLPIDLGKASSSPCRGGIAVEGAQGEPAPSTRVKKEKKEKKMRLAGTLQWKVMRRAKNSHHKCGVSQWLVDVETLRFGRTMLHSGVNVVRETLVFCQKTFCEIPVCGFLWCFLFVCAVLMQN